MKKVITSMLIVGFVLSAGFVHMYDLFAESEVSSPSFPTQTYLFGKYFINTQTIFSSLEEDDINSIFSTTKMPNFDSSESDILWTEEEYFKVANALSRKAWNESLNDWHLYLIRFKTPCQDTYQGFEIGELIYFKPKLLLNGQLKESVHGYGIYPNSGSVEWGGKSLYPFPFPFGWERINLNSFTLSPMQLLQIAEDNGLKDFRLSVINQCRVTLQLYAGENWKIYASDNNDDAYNFTLLINPLTNEIID